MLLLHRQMRRISFALQRIRRAGNHLRCSNSNVTACASRKFAIGLCLACHDAAPCFAICAIIARARVCCCRSRPVAAVPDQRWRWPLLAKVLHVPPFANGRSRSRLRCCQQFQCHSLAFALLLWKEEPLTVALSFPHPAPLRFVHQLWLRGRRGSPGRRCPLITDLRAEVAQNSALLSPSWLPLPPRSPDHLILYRRSPAMRKPNPAF